MLKFAKVILLVAGLCLLAAGVFAQAPNTLTYQGKLTDNALDPIVGPVDVTFSIYASEDVAEVPLWSETHDEGTTQVIPNELGIFTVELGVYVSFPPGLFDGSVRYVGITVGADEEMVPRQKITSAPYAMQSNTPGIAYEFIAAYTVTEEITVPASLTVTAPGPGYLLFEVTGWSLCYPSTVDYAFFDITISSSATVHNFDSYVRIVGRRHNLADGHWESYAVRRLIPVVAGTYTQYITTEKFTAQTCYIYDLHFTAKYFPTWIGSGAPPVGTASEALDQVVTQGQGLPSEPDPTRNIR